MEEQDVSGSQTETEEVFQDDGLEFDVREAFGLPTKNEEIEDESEEGEQSVNDKTPAIEDAKTDSNKRVVKFNKEDREIDESEVEGLLQKGLALDKQRERTTEYEKALERAAKLAGFNSHDELIANLDVMEQNQVKAKEDAFRSAKQKVIDDLVYSGVSEEVAIEYAENNPLVQQARQTMDESKQLETERQLQRAKQDREADWNQLYDAYPDIVEDSKKFTQDGGKADFFTPEMEQMYLAGYKPLDAYRLAHMDKIQTQAKKQAEQKVIKQQQLSSRSKVVDDGEQENRASEELKGAFAMFGIDPKRAQKYAK